MDSAVPSAFSEAEKNVVLNTALIACCMTGDRDTAEQLLSAGANPICVDEQIRTPLHHACRGGFLSLVTLLVDYGAEIESRDLSGNTALLVAARFGKFEVLQFLLESAAEVQCSARRFDSIRFDF